MPLPPYSLTHYKRATGFVLRKLRKQRGLSQEEAAFGVGMDRAHLARWESGEHEPGSFRLTRLLLFYDCPVGKGMERIDKRAMLYWTREQHK